MTTGGEMLADVRVSRETILRLQQFVELLRKWNPAINLVSSSTLSDAWSRHILDSAQLFGLGARSARLWVDLGSGGGFPGLVIACLAAELAPDLKVVLVESDQRKATFLRQANRVLGLSAEVLVDRIEKIKPLGANIVSARALAPLSKLCQFSWQHMAPGATALFPKGANYAAEIQDAQREWRFDLEIVPSVTEIDSAVLKLERLTHV